MLIRYEFQRRRGGESWLRSRTGFWNKPEKIATNIDAVPRAYGHWTGYEFMVLPESGFAFAFNINHEPDWDFMALWVDDEVAGYF